jgi:hypothetical protein
MANGISLAPLLTRIEVDLAGFRNQMNNAVNVAQETASGISKKMEGLNTIGKGLESVGSSLTKSVTMPVAGLTAAIVKVTDDFQTSMSKVSAISGATGSDLQQLTDKAKEMGAKTKFSAKESADAFTYMAMA